MADMDPGERGCHPIGLPRERLRKSGEFFDFRGKMPGEGPACGHEWLFLCARGSREKTDTQYRFPERELGYILAGGVPGQSPRPLDAWIPAFATRSRE